MEPFDVSEVLSKEVDRLRSAYPDANVTVEVDEPVVAAGGELLYSVFGNRLVNALEHNESQTPQIRVRAEPDGDAVVVTIDDDGPGLPEDVREQLAGRDLAHPMSSTQIVRSLVEMFNGKIAVETGDKGTTISVRLENTNR